MNTVSSHRSPALDIVRCTALLCVIGVHFFLHSGFWDILIVGPRLYLFTILRSMTTICVPLFLLLSGYLMQNKQPNRKYYTKLLKTYGIYFLASFCNYLFTCYQSSPDLHTFHFSQMLLQTLHFQACTYAWYMDMYWGLFLLIPFLNILYHGLATQKEKQALIFVLLLLTALPHLTNAYSYAEGIGWVLSSSNQLRKGLLPTWWIHLYPITYYFLGAYLHDYPLKLSRKKNALYTLAAFLLIGTFNYTASYGKQFQDGSWHAWGSPLVIAQTVLFFNWVVQGDYRRFPTRCAAVLARISELSFGAYLVSGIFDQLFHGFLHEIQPTVVYRLSCFPVVVLAVFVCSLTLSAILNLIYGLLAKLFIYIFCRQKVPV